MVEYRRMAARRTEKDRQTEKRLTYTASFKVSRSTTLLELLLSSKKLSLSRNSVKSLLHDHKVLVNGAVVTQFNYPLAKDDEVHIASRPVPAAPIRRAPKKRRPSTKLSRWVIYEDEDFLAINKPAGLLAVESDTKRESAYTYAVEYLQAEDPKLRPYVLHRIDRDTSGVLVFAKNIKIHSKLKGHWNQDVKLREYTAVVEGHLAQPEKTLVSYLKENQNSMVYATHDPAGKKAITHYEVLRENRGYSLLRVTIQTGRKNQIRVMLAQLGNPVVGDEKYGNGASPFHRLGLHASELDFIHPVTHQLVKLKAPLPGEFTALFQESSAGKNTPKKKKK